MEKTLAREIYKRMEPGRKYKTSDILKMLGDTFYLFQPEFRGWDAYRDWTDMEDYRQKEAELKKMRSRGITKELWSIVNAGYAATEVTEETYHIVRGLRYHSPNRDWSKVPTQNYTIRYWWRTK